MWLRHYRFFYYRKYVIIEGEIRFYKRGLFFNNFKIIYGVNSKKIILKSLA